MKIHSTHITNIYNISQDPSPCYPNIPSFGLLQGKFQRSSFMLKIRTHVLNGYFFMFKLEDHHFLAVCD
jgi:hypothetical protein